MKLPLKVVQSSEFAVRADMHKLTKNGEKLVVDGVALMCVNEMGIAGISAAFMYDFFPLFSFLPFVLINYFRIGDHPEHIHVISSIGECSNDFNSISGDCIYHEIGTSYGSFV
jgi:hypothetical protein